MYSINELNTPALLIEKSILMENIYSMQYTCNSHNILLTGSGHYERSEEYSPLIKYYP